MKPEFTIDPSEAVIEIIPHGGKYRVDVHYGAQRISRTYDTREEAEADIESIKSGTPLGAGRAAVVLDQGERIYVLCFDEDHKHLGMCAIFGDMFEAVDFNEGRVHRKAGFQSVSFAEEPPMMEIRTRHADVYLLAQSESDPCIGMVSTMNPDADLSTAKEQLIEHLFKAMPKGGLQ